MQNIKEIFIEIEMEESYPKLDFGFNLLNSKLTKMTLPSIISISGPIAKGKTSFVLNMVLSLAKSKANILYITSKEKPSSIAKKLLSIDSSISCDRIFRRSNAEEKNKIEVSRNTLSESNLYIAEIGHNEQESEQIENAINVFINNFKEKVVVIYDEYNNNLETLIALKRITAKEKVMIFLVSRINGNPFITFNHFLSKMPVELEQNSDCIIGIQRKKVEKRKENKDYLFAHIYKIKEDSLCTIKYEFNNKNLRLEEIEKVSEKELYKLCDEMLI